MNQQKVLTLNHPPPWTLQGEAYIFNYWVSPQFLQRYKSFGLTASSLGRMIQVLLVRYQHTPVGIYDELLILDHPLLCKKTVSTIPHIYVSSEISVEHGNALWGIPKQLAQFEWQTDAQQTLCKINVAHESLSIEIEKFKNSRIFSIDSRYFPRALLQCKQRTATQNFDFELKFKGQMCRIKNAQWQNTASLFPDFNQARFLQGFYVANFKLHMAEARIQYKTP